MVDPFMPEDEKLIAVRAALPALAAGIYLNTGSVGPLPAETARAMADLEAWELATGRGHMSYYAEFIERMAEARASIAAILGTDVGTVALTHATTDGMNAATWAVDWRLGDRAVSTAQEHPGGLGPLYILRDRFGITLDLVDIGDGGDDARTLAAFDAAIVPGTRLVSVSHVLWTTGAVLPLARIAEIAHARGALFIVDGAQSAGAIPFAVADTGADLYALPGQKWLLGPEGMGALWCSPAVLDRARMTFGGWADFESIDGRGTAVPHPNARRFEVNGYHRPSVVGLARSCGWLSMFVGLDWVWSRGPAMARRTADVLAAIPGVELLTPRRQMGTLVTFRIGGWPALEALEELGARTFTIARTIASLDALRVSVGFFSSEAELDRFADGVRLLAEHPPGSLPPRRVLAILGQDA